MYAASSGKSGPLHIQRQTNTCASTATEPESGNMEAYMEPGNFKYVLYRPWMVQICLGLSYSTWSSCSILEVRGWFHCQSHRRGYLKCSYFLLLNDSFLPSFFFWLPSVMTTTNHRLVLFFAFPVMKDLPLHFVIIFLLISYLFAVITRRILV